MLRCFCGVKSLTVTALCCEAAGSSSSWRPETLFIATSEGWKVSASLLRDKTDG